MLGHDVGGLFATPAGGFPAGVEPAWLPASAAAFGTGAGALAWIEANDDDPDAIEGVGDVTQYATSIIAYGMTWGAKDKPGRTMWTKTMAAQLGVVAGLKGLADKWRPNFSNQASFPSGHTSVSVTGAMFVQRRYGTRWAMPLHLLAAYTGYSRVFAQKHFVDDVLSGMSVGILANMMFTAPADPERYAH